MSLTNVQIIFLYYYLSICCYFTYIMHQRLAVYRLSIDRAAAGWLVSLHTSKVTSVEQHLSVRAAPPTEVSKKVANTLQLTSI